MSTQKPQEIADISNLRISGTTRKRRPTDDEDKPSDNQRTLKRYKSYMEVDEQAIRERLNSTSITPALDRVLTSLDRQDLLNILTNLLNTQPCLASTVSSLLPRPTLTSVASLLSDMEKRLNEAFPYTKWGKDTGDYSFNRVRPLLTDIRDNVIHYLLYFSIPSNYPDEFAHEYPITVMTYLHEATKIVHRLPTWENHHHNAEFKFDLYLRLGTKWREAIQEIGKRVKDGKIFSASLITEWGKNLSEHAQQTQGMYGFREALQEYKQELGWLVGVYPDPEIVEGQASIRSGGATQVWQANHPLQSSSAPGPFGR